MADFFQLFVLKVINDDSVAAKCANEAGMGCRRLADAAHCVMAPPDLVAALAVWFQFPRGAAPVLAAVESKMASPAFHRTFCSHNRLPDVWPLLLTAGGRVGLRPRAVHERL